MIPGLRKKRRQLLRTRNLSNSGAFLECGGQPYHQSALNLRCVALGQWVVRSPGGPGTGGVRYRRQYGGGVYSCLN
jgi:hypothetical protein